MPLGVLPERTPPSPPQPPASRSSVLAAAFDALREGVVWADAQGRVVGANPAARRLLFAEDVTPPEETILGASINDLLRGAWEPGEDGEAQLRREERVLEVRFVRLEEGTCALLRDVTDAHLVREAARRERFLARVSDVFAETSALEAVLPRIAELAVPEVADWCAVDRVRDGALERVVIRHVDPAAEANAHEMARRWPPSLERSPKARSVIETREAYFAQEIPDAMLSHAAEDEDHLRALRALSLGSVIITPLVEADRVVALCTFASESERRFSGADVEMARELTRRAALALDNAFLTNEARDAEQRFRGLFETQMAPLILGDHAGNITDANDAFLHLVGYSREELEAGVIRWRALTPDEYVRLDDAALSELEQSGRFAPFEKEYIAKDGTRVPILLGGAHLGDGSRNILCYVLDLRTQRRLEEQRSRSQRALAEAAVAMTSARTLAEALQVITDAARAAIGAHQAVTSMTRNQRWGQAITAVSLSERYEAYREYDTPPDGSGIYAMICERNETARMTQAELEAHPRWRGLGEHAAEHPPMRGWLAAPLVDRDGENLGLIQLSDKLDDEEFDASDEDLLVSLAHMASVSVETHMLLDALRAERDRATAASRVKDDFLAMLGHELRNPLAPMRTALELMDMGAPAFEDERRILRRQVDHMSRLVDDLLDISRITRGTLTMELAPVRLQDVIDRAIELASPLLEARSHHLTHDVDGDAWVKGDAHRLAQIASNLLTNAAKYTPPGGRVVVATRAQGARAILSVTDDGEGIAPELLPELFEAFVQRSRSFDRADGGLGLGLTIVRHLVEAMGGEVELKSEGLGAGTTALVSLPRIDPPPHAVSLAPRAPTVSTSLRVLVVDDNEDAAFLLQRALRRRGHEALVAYDGPSALELAATSPPDVALLDLGLPVMDGLELATRLRAAHPATLLVAVTGYGQQQDRERSAAAGFAHHLVKPIDLEGLLRLLGRHAAHSGSGSTA